MGLGFVRLRENAEPLLKNASVVFLLMMALEVFFPLYIVFDFTPLEDRKPITNDIALSYDLLLNIVLRMIVAGIASTVFLVLSHRKILFPK